MDPVQLKDKANQILQAAGKLLPKFLENSLDMNLNNGNVAMCIIDDEGQVHGKMWGNDKIRMRDVFLTAWRKGNQVWITGIASGKYEELVFTKQIDPAKFGIKHPDFIGWEGGLPVLFGDTQIAVAVSGMRSESDLEIIIQSVKKAGGIVKTY